MRRTHLVLVALTLAACPVAALARPHATHDRASEQALPLAPDTPPEGLVGLVSERHETRGRREYVETNSCTGFAIDTPAGQQIATARHCVRDTSPITVYDGERRAAGLHAVMPNAGPDVALLAADPGVRFPAVELADSHALRRGDALCAWRVRSDQERVYWDRSCARFLTRRVVDTGEGAHEMLLIEHALEPGFSGGPVFDAGGRVVGVGVAQGEDFDLVEPIEHVVALAPLPDESSTPYAMVP